MESIKLEKGDQQEQVAQLRELFHKYGNMYQLPGMSPEETERIFQEKYLPSVERFIQADKLDSNTDLEQIEKENKRKKLIVRKTESSFLHLKNIMLEGSDFEKLIIAEYIDELDAVSSTKEKMELIDLGLSGKQSPSVRLAFLGKMIILEQAEDFDENDIDEEVDKSIEHSIREMEKSMSKYFFWQYVLLTWGGSVNRLKKTTIRELEKSYNNHNHAFDKRLRMLILRCLLINDNEGRYRNENNLKKYVSWYEDEFNFQLYQIFNSDLLKKVDKDKTGGEFVLFGKNLRQKVVGRKMNILAFEQWRRAYESPKIWQESGFDYVPIEPIISFKNMENNNVRVSAGILGITLFEYVRVFSEYIQDDVFKKRRDIVDVLRKMNIDFSKTANGHLHNNNFCLKFERTPKGEIDLDKSPKVYLIDWDHAGTLD